MRKRQASAQTTRGSRSGAKTDIAVPPKQDPHTPVALRDAGLSARMRDEGWIPLSP